MFQFETQLNKLKHEVLTAVAKLAKDDKLTKEEIEKVPYEVIKGDTAMYRCLQRKSYRFRKSKTCIRIFS